MTDASESPAIEVQGLVKRYGDFTAVRGIDLRLDRGRCLGLLGPNGAGKTTTIEIIVGLRAATEGSVRVLGLSWPGDDREIRRRIGVQLQETRFPDRITVAETLRAFGAFYERGPAPEEIMELVGLEAKAKTRISALSGGQHQRLALGCALVNDPELLFLDEPTTGLDPQARRRVWEIVEEFKRRGVSVLLTTHYMDEAERLADDLVIIDQGTIIAEGSPAEIIGRLGQVSIVEFRAEGADDAFLAEVAELPGVVEAGRVSADVVVEVDSVAASVPAILALVEARGLDAAQLHIHRPTLEDVFVSLTGKRLRDV
ncbi:MAG: ABC transporter ATP-binding protein [Planctomycetota bacterium]